ncbi:MAG: proline--tRNA ligase, partial [Bacteroidota bacterium]|nr:proline--tRNA ligase [Bacteroidota bacterium]
TMKDSYSLDSSWQGLDKSYDLHAEAYKKIYTRCGLNFYIVGASSGAMGGSGSQEFMVESNAGEDNLAVCQESGYAANVEIATSSVTKAERISSTDSLKEVHTPNCKSIDEVAAFLKMPTNRCAKSLIFMNGDQPVLVLMLGNDQLNETKLQKVFGADIRPAHPEELMQLTGADAGSIGPVKLDSKFLIVADARLENANGLVCGANKNDYHLLNLDLKRDAKIEAYHDFRTVEKGELSPDGKGKLRIVKGIEVGHIFKLGTKYSESMKANFLDEHGAEHPIIMGSYGIGVERIIACHIEQHHDENGIQWQKAIAPYDIHLICVNMNSESVVKKAEELYTELQAKGISVLFDDRIDASPGFKFKDADLLGMPLQVIVGEKNLKNGQIELKIRNTNERRTEAVDDAVNEIVKFVKD